MQGQTSHPVVVTDEVMEQVSVSTIVEFDHFVPWSREEEQWGGFEWSHIVVLLKFLQRLKIFLELWFKKLSPCKILRDFFLGENDCFNNIFMALQSNIGNLLINIPNHNSFIIGATGKCLRILSSNYLPNPVLMTLVCSLTETGADLPQLNGFISWRRQDKLGILDKNNARHIMLMPKECFCTLILTQLPKLNSCITRARH